TRSGTAVSGARPVRLDASDVAALSTAARGMASIFVCTNPPYSQWQRQWPPIGAAVAAAAKASGASVVLMGNLYSYGIPAGPMAAASPVHPEDAKGRVRARLWEDLLAAHDAGDLRAVEVRASDYFGPRAAATSHIGENFLRPLLASRRAWVVGDPDLAHSWAYYPDIAATLAAVAADDGAYGRAWIVPSASDESRNQLAARVNAAAGSNGTVAGIPSPVLRTLGLFSPQLREVGRSSYQFRHPFVTDSTETEDRFGIRATDIGAALRNSLAAMGPASR
ncbi:MAG: NAD-dependent epimerase, partial [Actinomycetales bacterium]